MDYRKTIETLFEILAQCNAADSDPESGRQEWQRADDASQRCGAYGHIRNAIVALAGEDIVTEWADSSEVVFELANRLPQEQRVSLQELRHFGSVAACYAERKRRAEFKRERKAIKQRLTVARIHHATKQLRVDVTSQLSRHTAKGDANPEYLAALDSLLRSIDTIRKFH